MLHHSDTYSGNTSTSHCCTLILLDPFLNLLLVVVVGGRDRITQFQKPWDGITTYLLLILLVYLYLLTLILYIIDLLLEIFLSLSGSLLIVKWKSEQTELGFVSYWWKDKKDKRRRRTKRNTGKYDHHYICRVFCSNCEQENHSFQTRW